MNNHLPARSSKLRLLALPAAVVLVITTCVLCANTFFAFLFPPERPIQEITLDNIHYVLTCTPTLDGSLDLHLYTCEDEFDESCIKVESGFAGVGRSCDDELFITEQNGNIEVIDPHGIIMPILISYEPPG